jgi:hypothetical protein
MFGGYSFFHYLCIMKRKQFIKVQGKIYHLLGMNGGHTHLGLPFDVNNDVVQSCVIWEKQPFFNESEFGLKDKLFVNVCLLVRYFKVDVFGNSGFKNFSKKVTQKFA